MILGTINSSDYEGVTGGTMVIGPGAQTIAFSEIADHTLGDAPFRVRATASSGLPVTFSVISGPAMVTGDTVAITGVGTVILQAAQAGDANFRPASITQSFAIRAGGNVRPVISVPPLSQTVALGGTATFTVAGVGTPAPTFQWFLNLLRIPGANSAVLTIPNVQAADLGAYSVTLTNAAGLVTTRPAMLELISTAAPRSSRIVNFSARGDSGPGSRSLIVGFVVTGDAVDVLVRGIGPSLAAYGVGNPVADPVLTLYGPAGALATNDNWEATGGGQAGGAQLARVAAQHGAFPLVPGGRDSALIFTVNRGAHTAALTHPDNTAGIALAEIYDTDPRSATHLINVSVRAQVSAGDGTLIAGLVITGDAPKTVLIRGIGPTLAAFGVPAVLADPKVSLYSRAVLIAENDDWDDSANGIQVASAMTRVGAFALPAGSRDAAMVITLQPGSYTVMVSGAGGTTGTALIEIFDAQ